MKIGPNCEHLLRLTCSTTFRAPDTKTPAPVPSERNVFLIMLLKIIYSDGGGIIFSPCLSHCLTISCHCR